jgi:PhzF family phenazine biosynthesis protein
MSNPVHLYLVDAFAHRPFAGNTAGVCLLDGPRSESFMQAVAAEMKHSETAYLLPESDGWRLRWFTPAVEVALCGHATLASAHVLWTEGFAAVEQPLRFFTKSGVLGATWRAGGWIELDFPATIAVPDAPATGLLPALGLDESEVLEVRRSRFDYLVVLPSAAAVRGLSPDHRLLRGIQVRGVAVTAPTDQRAIEDAAGPVDFVSRFFAPGSGIDEDPVTGSAHCALAPYWAERLGRDALVGFQASARGGVVRVEVVRTPGTAEGDFAAASAQRVRLGGQAVTILRGELTVR